MYDRPFRWWVQSVMPVVFDDSLSYYEVLAKLTKYIEGLKGDVDQIEKILSTIEGIEDVTQFTEMLESIKAEIGNLSNLSTQSKTDLVSAINEVALKADIAYYKPPTGIPESDLSQGVQDKLNRTVDATKYIINNRELKAAPSNNSPADLGLGTYSVPTGGIPWDTLSQDVKDRIESGSGGEGGTKDYTDLSNKPQINGHTLNAGNNTAESLGLGTYSKPGTGIPESDLSAEVQEKLNTSGGIADSETSFVATRDYEAGELIYINGVLYKTKYKILSGTNLVPGNNIEVTDISAELESINSKIDIMASGEGLDSWSLVHNITIEASEGSHTYHNFFEYVNLTGGESYNFIITPTIEDSHYDRGYVIRCLKRDGTVVKTENVNATVDYKNQYRFTFIPDDTGEYYFTVSLYPGGLANYGAKLKIELEYTQSQGISELWAQINQASQLEPRVGAIETLVEDQQQDIENLSNIPNKVEDLEKDVTNLSNAVGISFIRTAPAFTLEQGAINTSNGKPSSDSSTNFNRRIRTSDFINTGNCDLIEFDVPEGYYMTIAKYSTNADSGYIETTSAISGYNVVVCDTNYIKWTIFRDDNANFAPSDFPVENFVVNFVNITDKSLSIEGKAADAKTVGDALLSSLKFGSYDGGDDVGDQTANTICIFNVRNKYGLPFNFSSYSRRCVLITFGGTEKMQILISQGTPKMGIFIRQYYQDAWVDWRSIEQKYNVYPTGDNTDRTSEIEGLFGYYDRIDLAPGEYYINALDIPSYKQLVGCGEGSTKLIYKNDAGDTNYAVSLSKQSEIKNVSVKRYHDETYIPGSGYENGVNGIFIGRRTGATDVNAYENTIENVIVEDFTGCGIFIRNVGQLGTGSIIKNARIKTCSVGIYLGNHAEYNVVEGCYCNRCHTGIIIMGGNNVVNSCVFCENETNCSLPKIDDFGTADNDAHGIIASCKFTHAGYYSKVYPGEYTDVGGYDIYGTNQSSSELISNCMIGYPIYFENRGQPVMFSGCNIRRNCTVTAVDSSIGMLGCMFQKEDFAPVVSGDGVVKLSNCFNYNFISLDN